MEQRLLDNLMELCSLNDVGLQVYVHAALIGKFIDWLNANNGGVTGDSQSVNWKVRALDAATLLDVKSSDNVFPLLADRKKIGYAKGLERQLHFQNLLRQAFPPRSFRDWHI